MGDREQMRALVRHGQENRQTLERIQDQEIRSADTAHAIHALDRACRMAWRDLPQRESSGLRLAPRLNGESSAEA